MTTTSGTLPEHCKRDISSSADPDQGHSIHAPTHHDGSEMLCTECVVTPNLPARPHIRSLSGEQVSLHIRQVVDCRAPVHLGGRKRTLTTLSTGKEEESKSFSTSKSLSLTVQPVRSRNTSFATFLTHRSGTGLGTHRQARIQRA